MEYEDGDWEELTEQELVPLLVPAGEVVGVRSTEAVKTKAAQKLAAEAEAGAAAKHAGEEKKAEAEAAKKAEAEAAKKAEAEAQAAKKVELAAAKKAEPTLRPMSARESRCRQLKASRSVVPGQSYGSLTGAEIKEWLEAPNCDTFLCQKNPASGNGRFICLPLP